MSKKDWKPEISTLKLNGSTVAAEQVKMVFIESNFAVLQRQNSLIMDAGKTRLLGTAGLLLFLVYMLVSRNGVYSFRDWSEYLSPAVRNALWRVVEDHSDASQCEWEQFAFENIPFGDNKGQSRPLSGEWLAFIKDVFPYQWKGVADLYKEAEKEALAKAQKGRQELLLSTISDNLKTVQGLQIADPEVKTALLAAIAGSLGYYNPTPSSNSAAEAEPKTAQPVKTQTSEEDTEGTFDD